MVTTLGEVMMRMVTPEHQRFVQAESFNVTFGGGEANVAAGLAQLGVESQHVTVFPTNELGTAAAQYYSRYGVNTSHIQFKEGRLGTYFLEFGAAMRASKIIYDRAGSAFAEAQPEWFNWKEILKDTTHFQWTGITPALSANCLKITEQALAVCAELNITVVADVNFRSNLWNYGKTAQEVMPDLIAQCDIITCSEKDAYEIFEMSEFSNPAYDAASFQDMGNAMIKRFPRLKKIAGTRRKVISASQNGLKGICYDGSYHETEVLNIDDIVDRIGGGDAFLAGVIYGELQKWPILKTLKFANAASALKHTIHGDVNLCSLEEIEEVMNGNVAGRIKR